VSATCPDCGRLTYACRCAPPSRHAELEYGRHLESCRRCLESRDPDGLCPTGAVIHDAVLTALDVEAPTQPSCSACGGPLVSGVNSGACSSACEGAEPGPCIACGAYGGHDEGCPAEPGAGR